MGESNKSFKDLAKATSLLGGVQIINILITIFRTKILAIYTGPVGVGINSLYNESINLIKTFSGFGLSTSGVRSVSLSYAANDNVNLSKTIKSLRFWVWITGIVGLFIGIALSSYLSSLTFNTSENTISYVILSFTILIAQLNAGQLVVLQGTRKIVWLSAANLLGSLLGSVLSVPIYYFFKKDGIVLSIVTTSISSLFFSWYYSRKIELSPVELNREEINKKGKELLILGFLVNISSIFTLLSSFLLRNFINYFGGLSVVGLFNAGFSIVTTYTGLIFTALRTDYYPRLTASLNSNDDLYETVNNQAEFSLHVLGPIIMIFLVFVNLAIKILYTNEFIEIESMVKWISIGILFKSLSWTLSFIFLAKGNNKVYLFNEIVTNIYFLLLNIAGYKMAGLNGLGISFIFCYIFYLVQLIISNKLIYNLTFSIRVYQNLFFYISLLSIQVFLSLTFPNVIIWNIIVLLIVFCYSFYFLNKRLDLYLYIKKYLRK